MLKCLLCWNNVKHCIFLFFFLFFFFFSSLKKRKHFLAEEVLKQREFAWMFEAVLASAVTWENNPDYRCLKNVNLVVYMTKCNMKNVLYPLCSLKSVTLFKRKPFCLFEGKWKVILSQALIMTPALNCYVAFDK